MKKKILLAAMTALSMTSIQPAIAGSADCAIWLCLPAGFPSGCGDAKSAFKNRIKKLKPPLPALSSCLVSGDVSGVPETNVSATNGKIAYYPPYRYCAHMPGGANGSSGNCSEWRTEPEKWLKGQTCSGQRDDPCQLYGYVDVKIDGISTGTQIYKLGTGDIIKVL
ncbi:hypothetical protein [Thaumasiovibrio subtropicus]|uniref:hypothetical protein n=1 Tax=Thaumasiovibrio subtropicus TaxID=1891207 RepID=UPI0018643778|nr:hypothetical protein [Thaumasiovibrio subtropicus]